MKKLGIKVVNFEDLGEGAKKADAVINALYPENKIIKNHYFGHNYFCPRDEFLHTHKKTINKDVKNILITFGGTDLCNLTKKTLDSIYQLCKKNDIDLKVILGLGYTKLDTLKKYNDVEIIQNVTNISEYMLKADIIFTSAGRTIYEIACLGIPAIVMAQNKRELTHFFASSEYGFINLGLGKNINNDIIERSLSDLIDNFEKRKKIHDLMLSFDLKNGKKRTIKIIKSLLED